MFIGWIQKKNQTQSKHNMLEATNKMSRQNNSTHIAFTQHKPVLKQMISNEKNVQANDDNYNQVTKLYYIYI